MANTITEVLPKLLAQGLLALRQNAVTPRLVNHDYESMAAQRGNVINIPVPSSIAARSVTPSVVMNSNVASAPTSVPVTLDRWMEAPFEVTDNDVLSMSDTFFPMQASEAIKSLANDADAFLLGKHVGIYGASGAAGTTPASMDKFAGARKLLNKQLAPVEDRWGLLDPDAESSFLQLSNILQADQSGSDEAIVRGMIGTKLGVAWYMNQNVLTYSVGGAHANGSVGGWAVSGANATVGVFTMTIVHASATGTIKLGDIFTVAGGSQQYVITANATITVTASERSIQFYPALATAAASAAAVTFIATNYVANFVANKYAFAWASRPLRESLVDGHVFQAPTDPISGIALRLEISRQYKLETLSYDYLAGCALVRRELAAKILG